MLPYKRTTVYNVMISTNLMTDQDLLKKIGLYEII
jgi:hypothetical protein